jgi:hypothetical protein
MDPKITAGHTHRVCVTSSTSCHADELRAVAQEIAETTGGPYTERELSEAREWLPSPSTPAG